MKKFFFIFSFFLLLPICSYAQDAYIDPLDIELRKKVFETNDSIESQKNLWESLKKRLVPLNEESVSEDNLENNMKILYYAMNLLLIRKPITSYNLFIIEIAKEAEQTYELAKKYSKKNKKLSPEFRLSFGELMFMITPIINRIDRQNPLSNPKGYIVQYDEFEKMRDIGDSLIKTNKNNLSYLLFIAEFEVATANHISILRSYRANNYTKKLIKIFKKEDLKPELAWAYLLQSSLYMRRSLNKEALSSLKKAEELYPSSFLVKAAWERYENNLPFM